MVTVKAARTQEILPLFFSFTLLHILFSVALALVWALLIGPIGWWGSLFCLGLAAVIAWRKRDHFLPFFSWSWREQSLIEKAVSVSVLYSAFRYFVYLFYVSEGAWKSLLKYNFGDLPFHIALIRTLTVHDFPWPHPSLASENLRYPFGADLYNALIESLGMPTSGHLFLFGFLATWMALSALRGVSGWFGAVVLFLMVPLTGWVHPLELPLEYSDSTAWKNLFQTLWIPQRSWLIGLPLGVVLFVYIQKLAEDPHQFALSKTRWMGFFWGLLPIIHAHSFVYLAIWFGFQIARHRRWHAGRIFLEVGLPVAVLLFLYQTDFLRGSSMMSWSFQGWMRDGATLWGFWWKNLGIWWIPLAVTLFLIARYERGQLKNALFLIGTFFLFQYWILAPWAWDNIKLLLWPFLGLSILIWQVYLQARPRHQWFWALLFLIPGIFFHARATQSQAGAVAIFQKESLIPAERVVRDVPRNAVFGSAPDFQHELHFLGYALAVGYEGHLWSQGYPGRAAIEKLKLAFTDANGWRKAASELNITHFFWGPRERQYFGIESPVWQSELEKISDFGESAVYLNTSRRE